MPSAPEQATREALLKAGKARGFPTLWYSATEGILSGPAAWENFTAHASAAKVTAAAAALKGRGS